MMPEPTASDTINLNPSLLMPVFALFIGAIGLIFGWGLLISLLSVFQEGWILAIVAILLGLISTGAFLLFGGTCVVLLHDWVRSRPLLILTHVGITDTRLSRVAIPWEDVEAARVLYTRSGPRAVLMSLKRRHHLRYNPLRIGCWSKIFDRKDVELCVSTGFLSKRSEDICRTIADLIEEHGGEVVRVPPMVRLRGHYDTSRNLFTAAARPPG